MLKVETSYEAIKFMMLTIEIFLSMIILFSVVSVNTFRNKVVPFNTLD